MNSIKITPAAVKPFVNGISKNTLSFFQETSIIRRSNFRLLLVLILGFALFSCSSDEDEIFTNDIEILEDVSLSYTVFEYQILDLVNEYRNSEGMSTLKILNVVSQQAIDHNEYMISVGKANHENFSVRHQNLVKNAGAKNVGENVAYGFSTAEAVMNAWIKSEGHRLNLLKESHTDVGISIMQDEQGRNYFTQIFIER